MNLHPICFKLEHSSVETIGMIQKAAAMGNLGLAASSRQHTVHASRLLQRFLAKHQITQVTQLHYSSDLTPWNFWIFPKLKLPWKGKRFQTVNEIQENMAGQLTVTGGTVGGPKVPALKGTEASLSCVQCFLCLVSSPINASIFHITWLDTFWIELIYPKVELFVLHWLIDLLSSKNIQYYLVLMFPNLNAQCAMDCIKIITGPY